MLYVVRCCRFVAPLSISLSLSIVSLLTTTGEYLILLGTNSLAHHDVCRFSLLELLAAYSVENTSRDCV